MKSILHFLLLMPTVLNAQDVNLQWAKRIGGTQSAAGISEGTSIVTDMSGNVYTIGHFNGTVDFDPGPGSYYLTGNGIFILKLNASGAFVWAKAIQTIPFSATKSTSIMLDDLGSIYVTGDFVGTIDFDPGPSNFTLSTNFPMCFLVKLDVSGNFIWAKKLGKSDIESSTNYEVKTDAGGNIYISGAFRDTADFDPGPGVYNLYGVWANYSHDYGTYRIFIAKLDSSGNFLWAKAPQEVQSGIIGITGAGLSVDNSGNVFLTGDFGGTVDFDPGPGVFIISNCGPDCLNGTDIFIWKLNTDGNLIWIKTFGEFNNYANGGDGNGLAVDAAGNIYSIGTFSGTLDFDPGPGVYNLSCPINQRSNYLSKIDSAGNFVWAKQMEWTYGLGYISIGSLSLDVFSNIYITGYFWGTADFDPGPGIYNLTDTGFSDKYIFKLNSDGIFIWAKQAVGIDTSSSIAISITTDVFGSIYTTGHFWGTVDFDPDTNVDDLTSVGQPNTFVDKIDTAGNFQWAKRIGGTQSAAGISEGASIVVDAAGNVYTAGHFNGTVDFDPGPGSYYLTGNGKFISKLNASGNFVWAKAITSSPFGGTIGISITLDGFGNIYVTGDFWGTVDFDPGPSNFTLSTVFRMCFLVKLDVSGNFIWAKKMGKTDPEVAQYHVKTDAAGNVYIAGSFRDTADFDPGPGVYNLYGVEANGSHDYATYRIFIAKLDSSGNFLWAKAPQEVPPAESNVMGIEAATLYIDPEGNIYLTGFFWGPVDFDPGPGIFTLTTLTNCNPDCDNREDIYVWKLNANGSFVWAKKIAEPDGYSGRGGGLDITVDGAGNIYSIGTFSGTLDFDPGPSVYNLTSPIIQSSNYISKLDSAGNFIWAKQIQNASLAYTSFNSLALDVYSNVYITGWLKGTIDFDPGMSIYNLTDDGSFDKFILKLNSDGNFVWAIKAAGIDTSYSTSISITTDNSGNIYTTGDFRGTVDFDPGTGVYNLTSVGQPNSFVDKLSTCANSASILSPPTNQQVCPGTTVVFSITTTGAIAYQWQLSTDSGITYTDISGATASSYTLTGVTTSENNYQYRCIITGGCNETISSAAVLYVSSTVISMEPQSTSVCAGTNHTFSVVASGASIYQWELSTDGGNTFNAIAGANSSSYNLLSVTTAQNGYQFRCIVMGICDTIISSNAVVSVIAGASITSHPAQTETCSGNNASFYVSGSSNQSISYQWQLSADGGTSYSPIFNGGVYSGATTSILMITGATVSLNNNRYRCEVSNGSCVSTISNAATLIVRQLPTVSLTAAPFTSLLPWQSTTLIATSVGTGGDLSLTWYYNNAIVPNIGNSRAVTFDQTGTYQVQIRERWPSDLVCSNQSDVVIIKAQGGSRLLIFPNPNHGRFKIAYYNSDGVSILKTVTVYDSKGAKVYRAKFTVSGTYTLVNINIIPASAGVYSVVISDINQKRLAVSKIVVY